jgi:hypothetical protein
LNGHQGHHSGALFTQHQGKVVAPIPYSFFKVAQSNDSALGSISVSIFILLDRLDAHGWDDLDMLVIGFVFLCQDSVVHILLLKPLGFFQVGVYPDSTVPGSLFHELLEGGQDALTQSFCQDVVGLFGGFLSA